MTMPININMFIIKLVRFYYTNLYIYGIKVPRFCFHENLPIAVIAECV